MIGYVASALSQDVQHGIMSALHGEMLSLALHPSANFALKGMASNIKCSDKV